MMRTNTVDHKTFNILYKGTCELGKSYIISTDEDPCLQIESFAVINICGVFDKPKG